MFSKSAAVFASVAFAGLSLFSVPVIAQEVSLEQVHRKAAFIPFINKAGPSADYLQAGLPRVIFSEMTFPVFISDFRTTPVRLDPRGEKDRKEIVRGSLRKSKAEPVLLNGYVHELSEEGIQDISEMQPNEIAARLETDYLVSGLIENAAGGLKVTVYLTDVTGGLTDEKVFQLSRSNPYNDAGIGRIVSFARQFFHSADTVIRVETEKPGALVFINDVYLGKTPLQAATAAGSYELKADHEECEVSSRQIKLQPGRQSSFNFSCTPKVKNSTLLVRSDPPGADVFLNHMPIGKTPLDRDDLPAGVHRIRVSKEGYIDRFEGVELGGDPVRVDMKLEEGDTLEYYTKPNYIIGTYTWNDLSNAALIQTLAFGGIWAYASIQEERTLDSARRQVPALSILDVPSYSIYQWQILEEKRIEAADWGNAANIAAGIGALNFLFSGFALYMGLAEDDKDFGELETYRPALFVNSHVRTRREFSEPVMNAGFSFRF